MAFQDYKPKDGLFGSKFVGLQKFKFLFSDDVFLRDIRNTLAMGVLNSGNHLFNGHYLRHPAERSTQHVRQKACSNGFYLPHFLSWIVVTGILHDALSSTGIINEMLVNLGILNSPINFFANPVILANRCICQCLEGNRLECHCLPGRPLPPSIPACMRQPLWMVPARWGKIWHVTLPGIKSTIMILLIMNIGNVLNAGFEVQYLLGNGLVKSVSETIDIYTLTWGISQNDYSLGTAAGIFKSVVAIILILGANWIAKRAGEDRLF